MTEQIVPFSRPQPFSLSSYLTPPMRTRSGRRYSPYGRSSSSRNRMSAARSAARRIARSRTLTTRRRLTRNTTGILGGQNADERLIYRRKRMPRSKRRVWARFVKKVNAVDERDLGTRTVLFNSKIAQVYTDDTKQGSLGIALYPFVNTSNGWLNDLQQIGQLENEGDPTAAAGATIERNSKIMFHSAVMDVTIRNTTQSIITIPPEGPPVTSLSTQAALEMDVYEFYMRKEASDGANPVNSMSDVINQWDEKEIGGTGVGIGIQDRGATPFELGSALGRFGIKILKKTKYFIPPGQTITFQCRDPRRHEIRYGELERNEGWNRSGWTKCFFMVYKVVPGLLVSTTDLNGVIPGIDVGLTRKYMYKVEGFNEPRERLITASYSVGPNV